MLKQISAQMVALPLLFLFFPLLPSPLPLPTSSSPLLFLFLFFPLLPSPPLPLLFLSSSSPLWQMAGFSPPPHSFLLPFLSPSRSSTLIIGVGAASRRLFNSLETRGSSLRSLVGLVVGGAGGRSPGAPELPP